MGTDAFHTGDVVRLKSGGPKMTLRGFRNVTDSVRLFEAVWFVEDELHKDVFTPAMVEACGG